MTCRRNRWIGIEEPFEVGGPVRIIVSWHLRDIAKGV
jgi:hypothetical protein